MKEQKRLCKSSTDKKLFGVCAGIADYFNIDPTIVRIIWLALVLVYGTGLLLYLGCALILPEAPTRYDSSSYKINNDPEAMTSDIDVYAEVEEVTAEINSTKKGEIEDKYI